jgi:DNA-binding transcriptional LysR family regulator
MGLSSRQLEAFSEVARTGSFSQAAKNLFVTQSALSQRVRHLEDEMATALIVRDPAGLRLTAAGEALLRYCHVRESLEAEVLTSIASGHETLGGVIRVAGFSSVTRSVVIPALSVLAAEYPSVNIEVFTREVRDLSRMLSHNEVEVIVTSEPSSRQEIVSYDLGFEENVLVESSKIRGSKADIYLDHDPEDPTTSQFFKINGDSKKKIRRNYLDEVYAIIDGVKLGMGRAVLPLHLVASHKDLRVVKGYKPLKIPVYLQYFRQPYYSRLHTVLIDTLRAKAVVSGHVNEGRLTGKSSRP